MDFDHLIGKTIICLTGKLKKKVYLLKYMFWKKWPEQSSPDPGKGVGSGKKTYNFLGFQLSYNLLTAYQQFPNSFKLQS